MAITTKQHRDLVRVTDDLIERLDNIGWSAYGSQYFQAHWEESKGHDRYRPNGIRAGISIKDQARLFMVQDLCRYLIDKETLDPACYIYTRKAIFFAYGLIKDERTGPVIYDWFAKHESTIRDINVIDFAEVNRDKAA